MRRGRIFARHSGMGSGPAGSQPGCLARVPRRTQQPSLVSAGLRKHKWGSAKFLVQRGRVTHVGGIFYAPVLSGEVRLHYANTETRRQSETIRKTHYAIFVRCPLRIMLRAIANGLGRCLPSTCPLTPRCSQPTEVWGGRQVRHSRHARRALVCARGTHSSPCAIDLGLDSFQ